MINTLTSDDASGFTTDSRNDRTIDLVFVLDLVSRNLTPQKYSRCSKKMSHNSRDGKNKISTLHFAREGRATIRCVVRYAASYAITVACSSERIKENKRNLYIDSPYKTRRIGP